MFKQTNKRTNEPYKHYVRVYALFTNARHLYSKEEFEGEGIKRAVDVCLRNQ